MFMVKTACEDWFNFYLEYLFLNKGSTLMRFNMKEESGQKLHKNCKGLKNHCNYFYHQFV